MKVDTDILSIHRGLLLFVRVGCEYPESGSTRGTHGERRPRTFIASVLARPERHPVCSLMKATELPIASAGQWPPSQNMSRFPRPGIASKNT
jgi:hypothetical protein